MDPAKMAELGYTDLWGGSNMAPQNRRVAESDDDVSAEFDTFVERYGEQAIKNFIYNRHCSRFDPNTASLDDATNTAWNYHTDLTTIVDDLKIVESYDDMDQYCRR